MSHQPKPTWYILGAGAMGCLWASYWRKAGFAVVLITTKPCTQTQLTLHNDSGTEQHTISYKTVEQLNEKIHYLLVSTKAQQTMAAIAPVKHHLDRHAHVLVLQNGMASEGLAQQLPTQSLFAAVTTDGAYRTDRHSVVHAGTGHTVIGAVSDKKKPGACNRLIEQLPVKHLNIEYCDNIRQQQWKKLALNCVINGLTAIYQCRNGELLTHHKARMQLKTLCTETFNIIHALGIHIATDAKALYANVESACTLTANNYSSMYQDIKYKRPTEIDFLNGYLCEQAKKQTLDCSHNQKIIAQIKQLEQNNSFSNPASR